MLLSYFSDTLAPLRALEAPLPRAVLRALRRFRAEAAMSA